MGLVPQSTSPIGVAGGSGSALLRHQFVERHRLFIDLGLAQDEIGHVVLDDHGFDFGQAVVVAEVPAHHVGRLFVAGGQLVDVIVEFEI